MQRGLEGEPEHPCVVGQHLLLFKLERDVGLWLERYLIVKGGAEDKTQEGREGRRGRGGGGGNRDRGSERGTEGGTDGQTDGALL